MAYLPRSAISGRTLQPRSPWAGQPACDTDGTRLAFMQKERWRVPAARHHFNPATPGLTPQPQFVGLASKFNVLDGLNLAWDSERRKTSSCTGQTN